MLTLFAAAKLSERFGLETIRGLTRWARASRFGRERLIAVLAGDNFVNYVGSDSEGTLTSSAWNLDFRQERVVAVLAQQCIPKILLTHPKLMLTIGTRGQDAICHGEYQYWKIKPALLHRIRQKSHLLPKKRSSTAQPTSAQNGTAHEIRPDNKLSIVALLALSRMGFLPCRNFLWVRILYISMGRLFADHHQRRS